jgi:hypothetical protein
MKDAMTLRELSIAFLAVLIVASTSACGGSEALDAAAAHDASPSLDGSDDALDARDALDAGGGADGFDDGSVHLVDSGNLWDGHQVPDAPTACGPDTCVTGCCDSQGRCVDGLGVSLCGGGGNRCIDCGAQGAMCIAFPTGGGVCAKSAACGPQNCHGCCQGDTCVLTIGNSACGSNGEACSGCAAGDFCKGTCVHTQATCDSTNCTGCCAGAGFCVTGTGDNACGRRGQSCQSCQPSQSQGQCVSQADGGGVCNGVESCTPLNCSGCCDGNICRIGTLLAQCGANGTACASCGAGQQCVGASPNGGSCQSPPTCTAGSCSGCCQGNTCVAKSSDTACGPGSVCQDCTAFGQICVGGECIDPYGCNPATCVGCCIGGLCAVGNQDIACKESFPGRACMSCAARGLHCVSGGCR